LPNNTTIAQPIENNQTHDVNQQLVTLEHVTTYKTLEEILKDIITQDLETKYTLNLGQLLKVIHDVKCYIFNLMPSKPILLEPTVVSVAIDHQRPII
jgi:hypothetical protein